MEDTPVNETAAFTFHRRLWTAIEGDIENGCATSDCECDTGKAIRALFAVIWLHCPSQWFNAIMRGQETSPHADDMCVTCATPYPCRNIVAVADEFGVTG